MVIKKITSDPVRIEKVCYDAYDPSYVAKIKTILTFFKKGGKYYSNTTIYFDNTVQKTSESELTKADIDELTLGGKLNLTEIEMVYTLSDLQPGDEKLPTRDVSDKD
jgi:hypothetical protein